MSLSDRFFHNMRNLLITFMLLVSFGCSQLEKDLGVPNPELDTTDRGIAAGAAIGAGLGALVGSTAGEAGVGLVVGSVAGATTGGVIGKSFQDQEELSRTQDEKIQSQEERLSDQERQLEELRNRNLRDTSATRAGKKSQSQQARVKELPLTSSKSASRELVSEKNSPSRVSKSPTAALNPADITLGRAEAREVARGKLREDTIGQSKTSSSKAPPAAIDSLSQTGKGRVREEVVTELPPVVSLPEPVTPALDGTGANSKAVSAPPSSSSASSGLPPAATAVAPKVPASIAKVDAPTEEIALDEKKELKTNKKDSKATQTAKKTPSTTEQKVSCPEARQEADRARNAASESDKVFYLRRAMRLCPQDSSLHVELGKVYSGLGLKDDARGEFHKALEVDPENETAQDELSVMMLEGNS